MFAKPAAERDAALDELKIYGRDPSYSDPIFTKEVNQLADTCTCTCSCTCTWAGI